MLSKDNERIQREANGLHSSKQEIREEMKGLRKMNDDLTQQLVATNEQYRKWASTFLL